MACLKTKCMTGGRHLVAKLNFCVGFSPKKEAKPKVRINTLFRMGEGTRQGKRQFLTLGIWQEFAENEATRKKAMHKEHSKKHQNSKGRRRAARERMPVQFEGGGGGGGGLTVEGGREGGRKHS